MKIRHFVLTAFLLLAGVGALALAANSDAADAPKKLRIGVYDSRAIAIAYAPSKYNPVGEKMKEMKEAEAAKDEARIKELKAWGESHQKQLHWQGFGRYPVDDLLAHIKAELPRIAREAGVDIIAASADFAAPSVEVVDITEKLVEPFEPSERTWKWIRQMKDQAPVPFETLDKMKAED